MRRARVRQQPHQQVVVRRRRPGRVASSGARPDRARASVFGSAADPRVVAAAVERDEDEIPHRISALSLRRVDPPERAARGARHSTCGRARALRRRAGHDARRSPSSPPAARRCRMSTRRRAGRCRRTRRCSPALLPRAAGLNRAPGEIAGGCKPVLEAAADRVLPEVLRRAGYRTRGVSSNIWVVGARAGFATGFDDFATISRPAPGRWSRRARRPRARWALDALRARGDDGAADAGKVAQGLVRRATATSPFFWFVNLIECHSPYLPPQALQRPGADRPRARRRGGAPAPDAGRDLARLRRPTSTCPTTRSSACATSTTRSIR